MNPVLLVIASRNASVLISVGGSFSLAWVAPTTMGDGTAVTGLTGYKVYWSTTPYDVSPPNSASVSGAGTLTYTITGLASGTYYAWVSAITASGESPLSPAYNQSTLQPYWVV